MIINHWAVFVCALFNMLLGAVYYSPALFFDAWKRESNVTDEQLQRANRPMMYGVAFILAWMMSYNMAFFLGDAGTDWTWGLTAGFLTGFGWAAAIFASLSLFEQKSWKYVGINAGYIVIYFSVIGLILGAWR